MHVLARLPALMIAFFALTFAAHAQPGGSPLVVTIDVGNVDPLPIAVTDFIGEDSAATERGQDIARVITNNLRNSGLFAPVDPNAFIEDINNIDLRPRFADWRVINASALLVGRVSVDDEGRLLVADEIHTPDSSRYWHADGLEAALRDGTRPPSFDKDVIRAWVAARCDPYHDPIPEIPTEMILETSRVYIEACEAITGAPFVPDLAGETPLARIRANLAPYFTTPPA